MRKPETCQGCPFYGASEEFVPDDVPNGTQVIFFAQNPGRVEAIQGRPLVGPVGQLFRDRFVKPYLGAQSVGYANVLHCRWGETDELPPVTSALWQNAWAHCRQYHDATVAAHPNALRVYMGKYAAVAMGAPTRGEMTSMRGSYWPDRGFLIEHPGVLLPGRQPEMRDAYHNDFKRIVRILAGATPTYKNEFYRILDADLLKNLVGADTTVPVALDLETTSGGVVDMIGLAVSPTRAGILYLPDDIALIESLAHLLADRQVIVHYAEGLEAEWLAKYTIRPRRIDDLHKLHHAWDPEYPHDLAFIQSLYSGRPFHKHWLYEAQSRWEKAVYCLTDCVVEWECFTKLYAQMQVEAPEALAAYERHGRWVPLVAAAMNAQGWRVDEAEFVRRKEALTLRVDMLGQTLRGQFPGAIPKSKTAKGAISREGLKKVLMGLGIRLPRNRKTGRATLNREVLQGLVEKYPDQALEPVLDYFTDLDFLGDFYKDEILGHGGYCYPHWSGFLETWRWRVTKPNITQHPASERSVFVAEEGYTLLQADTSGGEYRILAGESQCPVLLKAFDEYDHSGDPTTHPHVATTAALFAVDRPTAVAWKAEDHALHARYTFSKNYTYRLMYAWGGCSRHNQQPCAECTRTGNVTGGGIDALRATAAKAGLKFSRADIAEFDRVWFDQHPVAAAWRARWVAEALQRRITWCREWGYMRRLHGQNAGIANEALNHPMQAGIAGLLNEVIVGLWREHGMIPLTNMHDGVVYHVRKSEIHGIQERVWKAFRYPFATLEGMVVPVDMAVGHQWGRLTRWGG